MSENEKPISQEWSSRHVRLRAELFILSLIIFLVKHYDAVYNPNGIIPITMKTPIPSGIVFIALVGLWVYFFFNLLVLSYIEWSNIQSFPKAIREAGTRFEDLERTVRNDNSTDGLRKFIGTLEGYQSKFDELYQMPGGPLSNNQKHERGRLGETRGMFTNRLADIKQRIDSSADDTGDDGNVKILEDLQKAGGDFFDGLSHIQNQSLEPLERIREDYFTAMNAIEATGKMHADALELLNTGLDKDIAAQKERDATITEELKKLRAQMGRGGLAFSTERIVFGLYLPVGLSVLLFIFQFGFTDPVYDFFLLRFS